jgi:phospholipid/cholesterol/gamma-HCH transport system ATP-binding protein
MMTPVVELKNIGMSFDGFTVHRDISFSINSGEVVTLLGPSGTGKTVILKMIIGLIFPTKGSVTVLGKDLNTLEESELTKLRADIGMLFQGAALFDSLSVRDNITYSLRERKTYSEGQMEDIVKETLQIIGLPGIENKFPPELSGGQKKRVGLARALASSPKIMLFDEPTTGLDPTATRLIGDLILKLKRNFGITSLVVTHDIDTARRVSDRWILLNEGYVVADGPVKNLEESIQDVNNFVKGMWKDE